MPRGRVVGQAAEFHKNSASASNPSSSLSNQPIHNPNSKDIIVHYVTRGAPVSRVRLLRLRGLLNTDKPTRVEDEAYCLLGLFGINMPLLYGEGPKAFIRLQHEIVKFTTHESIFAWNGAGLGMFAKHSSEFYYSRDILPYNFDPERSAYSITNKGFCLEPILYQDLDFYSGVYVPLNCYDFKSKEVIVITLAKVDGDRYKRQSDPSITKINFSDLQKKKRLGRELIYVINSPVNRHRPSLEYVEPWLFRVQLQNVLESGFTIYRSTIHAQRKRVEFCGTEFEIKYYSLALKDCCAVTHKQSDCFVVVLQGTNYDSTFGVDILVLEETSYVAGYSRLFGQVEIQPTKIRQNF